MNRDKDKKTRQTVCIEKTPECPPEDHTDLSIVPAGQDVVFHVATAQYFGGEGSNSKNLMHGVNVLGTQNVIDACVIQEVPKLVYTSSASVIFEGKDLVNVDEATPYAAKPMDYYTGTKASMCGTLNDLLLFSALPMRLLYDNHLLGLHAKPGICTSHWSLLV